MPRMHHQLIPDSIILENDFPKVRVLELKHCNLCRLNKHVMIEKETDNKRQTADRQTVRNKRMYKKN